MKCCMANLEFKGAAVVVIVAAWGAADAGQAQNRAGTGLTPAPLSLPSDRTADLTAQIGQAIAQAQDELAFLMETLAELLASEPSVVGGDKAAFKVAHDSWLAQRKRLEQQIAAKQAELKGLQDQRVALSKK